MKRPVALVVCLLAGLAQAQVFEPVTGLNPAHFEAKPEAASKSLFELGWCGVGLGGHVTAKPAMKLTLPAVVKSVRVRGSVPFVLMLPGNKVFCSNRFGEVVANELPAGELAVYPTGINPKAPANADYGFRAGETVELELDALEQPLRFAEPAQKLSWSAGDAPQVVRATLPNESAAVSVGNVNFAPLALVEVKSAMDHADLRVLRPPSREAEPRVVLLPLDVPRAKQGNWLAGENAFDPQHERPLLPGRFVLLASPGAGPVRVVLSQRPQPSLFIATNEADLPAYAQGLEAADLSLHAPFLAPTALEPKSPAELEERLTLWKSLPAALRVTLVLDRKANVLGVGDVTVRAGEPLLMVNANNGRSDVMTADGVKASFDNEVLTRTAPAKWVLPEAPRAFESTDDDSLLLFKTPALAKLEARFKDADAKAEACWKKNYNPRGQDYDVVTYRNGRVVNVESLDERFRKQAEGACKAPLANAEKLRKELFKGLAPEAKKVRAEAWKSLRALLAP